MSAEDQAQRDHDLLIEINTKLSMFMDMFTSHKRDTDNEINQLKKDVSELKEEKIKNAGFQAGKKAAFTVVGAIIGAVPASAILAIEKLL